MTPQHHLGASLTLPYVGGGATDAEALIVATHLTLCQSCRQEVAAQERLAGELLERGGDTGVPDAVLAATLAALGAPGPAEAGRRSPHVEEEGGRDGRRPLDASLAGLPAVLQVRLAAARSPRFRFLAPGMKGLDLPTTTRGVRLRLMRLAAGIEVPSHGHGGTEYTLVLDGAFKDEEDRRFGVGDLCVREAGEAHRQEVERGAPCIALQLNEGPLLPLTLKGRVLSALFDRRWSPGDDRL